MNDVLGFVVIEFNQASHGPGLPSGELHGTERDAQQELDGFVADTAARGRRERYRFAEVALIDERG